jgi:hypothetical protein
MGKGRRRRRQRNANFKHYQTFVEEEQQQNTLETQRQQELHFSCISHNPSSPVSWTLDGVQRYCSTFGKVAACYQVNGRPSNSSAPNHRPGWCCSIAAVVEMAAPAAAAQILQQRQLVQFQGKKGPYQELALNTPFGFLRSSSCFGCRGRIGKTCSCPKYSK